MTSVLLALCAGVFAQTNCASTNNQDICTYSYDNCCWSETSSRCETCTALKGPDSAALTNAYTKWAVTGSTCYNALEDRYIDCDTSVASIRCPDMVPPITCDDEGNVLDILLGNDGLTGQLGPGILDGAVGLKDMQRLEALSLAANHLEGSIPASLGDMSDTFRTLFLYNNQLRGAIPDLTALANLDYSPEDADTQCRITQNDGSLADGIFGPETNCFSSGCEEANLPTACSTGAAGTGYETNCNYFNGVALAGGASCPAPVPGTGRQTTSAAPATPPPCSPAPVTEGMCKFPAGLQIAVAKRTECEGVHANGGSAGNSGSAECIAALRAKPDCPGALNAQVCSTQCPACLQTQFTRPCKSVCDAILAKCADAIQKCALEDVLNLCQANETNCRSLIEANPPPPPPCMAGLMGCPCDAKGACTSGLSCVKMVCAMVDDASVLATSLPAALALVTIAVFAAEVV